jgi:cell wall assembly regulator SMI1
LHAGALLSRDLLEELEACWRAQHAPVADHLAPGLSVDEIGATIAPLGLELPVEALTWWGWHDGTVDLPGASPDVGDLGPGWVFWSLRSAVSEYQRWRESAAEAADEEPETDASDLWHPQWFPSTTRDTGTTAACDCSVPFGEPTPMRAVNWWDEFFEDVQAQSFGEVVQWWIETLQCRAWRYYRHDRTWQYDWEILEPTRQVIGLV